MCIRQFLASVVLLTYTGHARQKAKFSKRVSSANPHNAVKYVTNNKAERMDVSHSKSQGQKQWGQDSERGLSDY